MTDSLSPAQKAELLREVTAMSLREATGKIGSTPVTVSSWKRFSDRLEFRAKELGGTREPCEHRAKVRRNGKYFCFYCKTEITDLPARAESGGEGGEVVGAAECRHHFPNEYGVCDTCGVVMEAPGPSPSSSPALSGPDNSPAFPETGEAHPTMDEVRKFGEDTRASFREMTRRLVKDLPSPPVPTEAHGAVVMGPSLPDTDTSEGILGPWGIVAMLRQVANEIDDEATEKPCSEANVCRDAAAQIELATIKLRYVVSHLNSEALLRHGSQKTLVELVGLVEDAAMHAARMVEHWEAAATAPPSATEAHKLSEEARSWRDLLHERIAESRRLGFHRHIVEGPEAATLANDLDLMSKELDRLQSLAGVQEREIVKDWSVDDSETARKILSLLGIAGHSSLDPGAHPLRDKVAAIIATRIEALADRVFAAEQVTDSAVTVMKNAEALAATYKAENERLKCAADGMLKLVPASARELAIETFNILATLDKKTSHDFARCAAMFGK